MRGLPDSVIATSGMKVSRRVRKSSRRAESVEIFTPEFKKAMNDWFKNLEAQLKEKK